MGRGIPVKIVLDNTILVRAHERAHGLGRALLRSLVESRQPSLNICTSTESPCSTTLRSCNGCVLDALHLMAPTGFPGPYLLQWVEKRFLELKKT